MELIEYLIEKKGDINNSGKFDILPFIMLSNDITKEKAEKLAEYVDLNFMTKEDKVPLLNHLFQAEIYPNFHFIKRIIERGVDLNVLDLQKQNCLHYNFIFKNNRSFEMIKLLLESKVNCNARNNNSEDPLYLYFKNDEDYDLELIKIFIENKYEFTQNAIKNLTNKFRTKKLTEKNKKVLLFLAEMVKINPVLVTKYNSQKKESNILKDTFLHSVCLNPHLDVEILNQVLEILSDELNTIDYSNGHTPVELLASNKSISLDVLKTFLDKTKTSLTTSLLTILAENENISIDIIDLLINFSPENLFKDSKFFLHFCSHFINEKRKKVFDYLTEKGEEIKQENFAKLIEKNSKNRQLIMEIIEKSKI